MLQIPTEGRTPVPVPGAHAVHELEPARISRRARLPTARLRLSLPAAPAGGGQPSAHDAQQCGTPHQLRAAAVARVLHTADGFRPITGRRQQSV